MILIWSMECMEGERPIFHRQLESSGQACGARGIPTSVYTEYLIINHNAQSQKVEHVGKIMPHIGVPILPRTLSVEAIGLGDAARLVVAADQVHAVRIPQLEADEEGDGLDAEHAAVDIVAEEEVVCVRAVAADPEYLDEVEELPVDVAHDGDGRGDVDDVALAHQQLLSLGAYRLDDGFREEFFLVEACYALVQVDRRCG
jgi:hypothetical protein